MASIWFLLSKTRTPTTPLHPHRKAGSIRYPTLNVSLNLPRHWKSFQTPCKHTCLTPFPIPLDDRVRGTSQILIPHNNHKSMPWQLLTDREEEMKVKGWRTHGMGKWWPQARPSLIVWGVLARWTAAMLPSVVLQHSYTCHKQMDISWFLFLWLVIIETDPTRGQE